MPKSNLWENVSRPFPDRLESGRLLGHLEDIQLWSSRTLQALDAFAKEPTLELAIKCSGYFAMALSNLEDNIKHPSDMDKVSVDKDLFRDLTSSINGIKSKILPFIEGQCEGEKEGSKESKDLASYIVFVKNALTRADIYLASSSLAKAK